MPRMHELNLDIHKTFVHSWPKKGMSDIIYKEESYEIIGHCFEVHNNLGAGFLDCLQRCPGI